MFEMLAKERRRFKATGGGRFSSRYEETSGILKILFLQLIYQGSNIRPNVNNNTFVKTSSSIARLSFVFSIFLFNRATNYESKMYFPSERISKPRKFYIPCTRPLSTQRPSNFISTSHWYYSETRPELSPVSF